MNINFRTGRNSVTLLAGLAICQGLFAEEATAGKSLRFPIESYSITGNSLLPPASLEAIVAPFTGADRDFGDIQEALEALENAYRKKGYASVGVLLPEQKLDRGVVQLRVVEGKIGSLVIKNESAFDEENIRNSLPSLKEGEVPNSRELSRNLVLINENPAKQTQVLLKPGSSEDEIKAEVGVTGEKVWRVIGTLDNSGTNQTGNVRLGVGLQYANVANLDHVATVQYITSPGRWDDINTYGVGYRIPVYSWGGAFEAFAGKSKANIGTVGGLFNVNGSGDVAGIRYTQLLPNVGAVRQKLAVGLDYRYYNNNVVPVGGTTNIVPDYSISPASLTYTGELELPSLSLSFYGSYAQNAGFLGKHAAGSDLDAARAGAKRDYGVWRGGANLTALLPEDWRVRAQISGQFADNRLVPGEQFGLGGASSVRGFNERILSDDNGTRGSLELYTPDLSTLLDQPVANFRFLVFYDVGHLSRNNPLAGESPSQSIASSGVGFRIASGKDFSFGLDWAKVIDGTPTQPRGADRVHATLAVSY